MANRTEGYVKASAYAILKRRCMAVAIFAATLFACLMIAVFIRVKPASGDMPAGGMNTAPGGGEASDIEVAEHLSSQEKEELERQVADLTDELERRDSEYYGTQLLSVALQIGHNSVLFNSDDITIKSSAAEYQLNDLLQDGPLHGFGWEFLKAERDYEVNAIALIILATHITEVVESDDGFRFALQNRAGEDGVLVFDIYEECINHLARIIKEDYLDPNGRYFEGTSFSGVFIGYTGAIDEVDNAATDAEDYRYRLNTTHG